MAGGAGASPSQVAIAWLGQRPGVIIPILGARTLAQLKDNMDASSHTLSEGQVERLDEVSGIDLGFPHEFTRDPFIRDIVFGGTQDLIDNHRL